MIVGATYGALDYQIKIKELQPQMKFNTLSDGLTLVVIPEEKKNIRVKAVDPTHQSNLQLLNVVGFIGVFIGNAILPQFANASLSEISDQQALTIQPAGWAFSIWGIIYMLLTTFVVYQALPDSVVPERNNDLIFNKLGYLPCINFSLTPIWFYFFQ